MLLTGTFERTLDEKSRLAIPKRMRDAVSDQEPVLYLTRGTDGSLTLYPESSFADLGSQLGSASPNGKEVRAFSRVFYAQTERLEIDKQGRVRIPPEMAQLASIEKEVVLLGVRDHIEIWDKKAWQDYLDGIQPDYDHLAEEAFEISHNAASKPSTTTIPTATNAPANTAPNKPDSAKPDSAKPNSIGPAKTLSPESTDPKPSTKPR